MNLFQKVSAASVLAAFIFFGVSFLHAAADPFPMPDVIAPNVTFWTKVYAQYSSRQGIIHDNLEINRIYEIIDLLSYDTPGADKINRQRMKTANQKYESILRGLAQNPDSTNPEYRRVAKVFDEPRDSEHFRLAADRVRCQIGQKDRFQTGLVRSGAYLEEILSILQAYDLPEDLSFLPHVESSFNPHAYSKFGAAGLWQFTRSTGKRFMQVDYVLDERRDPIRSTHAAAQLLKENYARLGNWPLAITAYNHGTAGMERAKTAHGDYARIFESYKSPSFKFASRNFYSEFLAARQVASNYQNHFGELILDQPVAMRTVVLEGYASFKDLCAHFNIDPETLKQMNLALRQPVFSNQKHVPKGYSLRLPALDVERASLMAAIPDSIYRKEQQPSRFYTVQKGDTAGMIARIHGVKAADLILANNLDHRGTIYPRQTLRIPRHGETLDLTVASVANPPALKTQDKTGPQKVVQAAAVMSVPETGVSSETETKIVPAPEKIVPASELMIAAMTEHNDSSAPQAYPMAQQDVQEPSLQENTASPEQADAQVQQYPQPMLASIIPLQQIETAFKKDDETAAGMQARNEQIVTADVGFERVLRMNGRLVGIIRVEVEETLGHYAEWAEVRTQQIRKLNGMHLDDMLRLHQKINIPLHRVNAEKFEQNRYEYHKRLQEDFFAVYRIGDLQSYHVRKGDNYWTLCREKFQVPMWLLKHANPEADLADLRIHQKLIIPTIEKASSDDADPGIEAEIEDETVEPSSENGMNEMDGDAGSEEAPVLQNGGSV